MKIQDHTWNSKAIEGDVREVLWEGRRGGGSDQEKQARRFPGICQVEKGEVVKV